MARYFFDLTEAGHCIEDEFGAEFVSDEEAREEALAILPLIMRDARIDADGYEIAVTVRDEHGRAIYEATLALHGR